MQDNSEFYKELGLRIRTRRGNNLSQEALAFAIGLSRPSISNIEGGRHKIRLHTLVDIADALNVDASTLLPLRVELVAPIGVETLAGLLKTNEYTSSLPSGSNRMRKRTIS